MNSLQAKPQLAPWTEPPPMNIGAPCPVALSDGSDLLCAYFVGSATSPRHSVALLKFESVLQRKFGHPNDEALQGHLLHPFGLQPYGFFTVENSPLIAEIENQNGCHSRHHPGIYARFRHWIITFHDQTLEVVALRASVRPTELPSPEAAVCQKTQK